MIGTLDSAVSALQMLGAVRSLHHRCRAGRCTSSSLTISEQDWNCQETWISRSEKKKTNYSTRSQIVGNHGPGLLIVAYASSDFIYLFERVQQPPA